MKTFFYHIIAFVVICNLACINKKKLTESGQPKARFYKFSKEKTPGALSQLDTTHIYVFGLDLVTTYIDKKSQFLGKFSNAKTERAYEYSYLKFSSNGLAFYSGFTKEPFTADNIYYAYGQYCFYKVEGDEIRLEYFDWHLKKFSIMYIKVLPDGVLLYKDKLRVFAGGTSKYNWFYKKSEIKYLQPLQFPD